MNILIPMAGAGSRFTDQGYTQHKPVIPTTDCRTGKKVPMVVAATRDLPYSDKANIIYIDRSFHKQDGVEELIQSHVPNSKFITIDYLTEGQASTCLLAKNDINNDEELLIAGCDNGMIIDLVNFTTLKEKADCLIFTHRNHELVLENPKAYGWIEVDKNDNAKSVSVKMPISDTPLNDHAIVATFWFKKGSDFVSCAEEMIMKNDRINNEFYVDQVIKYVLARGLKTKVFEVKRYLGWGTPKDYETYENTISYWQEYLHNEDSLK